MFDCQICTNLTIKYLKYTLYVTIPLAGSPAAEGGQLKKGDVLVEVNGENVYVLLRLLSYSRPRVE